MAANFLLNAVATNNKRGRRTSSKSSVRQSIFTTLDIDRVVENDNHVIWKKIILTKHALASMSDLSQTVTGSDEINTARLRCVEKLLAIGCLLNGDKFLNGKQKAVLKNSPEDPRLISALHKYHIDMDEYKQSFNNHIHFGYKNDLPMPAVLSINANKNKFTQAFVDKLQADPFYSVYLRIAPEHVLKSSGVKRKTTSSNETGLFRQQKKQKVAGKQKNAGKHHVCTSRKASNC
ncbi:unnamed protein product [Rotaria magnacalcarata]|uniref:Uncharacterized protein n=1 Tax=Rotaria magnacalcarata TaxID=392030 RepID=A0A816WYF4_9BILA|nr:unnamed protein product [Rotaria magnacalcarata]CAF1290196.1 unnamed protein product [Rotaria magnacalcarata]CAF2139568.1 unnamed protein product [Rotaria magnacalcarata]CAF3979708.1 unnamed protein product [Rotaria magnacalcarata]CAF4012985.1 unnamed protein product [Rotaria magnacalcarata]